MLCLVAPVKPTVHKQITKKERVVIGPVKSAKSVTKKVKQKVIEINAGYFEITAYTNSPADTGKSPGQAGFGVTASGKPAISHHTIAADWSVLPVGTQVKIQGLPGTYTVEDTGSAIHGRHIDLFVASESAAVRWGVKLRKITIVKR